MKIKIGVAPSLLEDMKAFLEREGFSLEAVPLEEGPGFQVLVSEKPRRECEADRLFQGGRIPCAQALAASRELGLPPAKMGKLLDHLEIKVHHCQLGCF